MPVVALLNASRLSILAASALSFGAVAQRQLFRLGSLARLRFLRSGFNEPVLAVLEHELPFLVEGDELGSA